MARTKEFDPDVALHGALELFWEHGYEGTSMSDLVEHLGVSRASMYATFGPKHDLYVKALDRYAESIDPGLLERLSQPGPATPLVHDLVYRYIDDASTDVKQRGCFIVNAATDQASHDPQTKRRVLASWDFLETAITSTLIRARAQNELAEGADPRALARMVLVFLQGIRVIGRVDQDRTRLRDAAGQLLSIL